MNRRRNHPIRGDVVAAPPNFWREAVGPGLQVATDIDRVSRLRRTGSGR
jgi:hypothetical protein